MIKIENPFSEAERELLYKLTEARIAQGPRSLLSEPTELTVSINDFLTQMTTKYGAYIAVRAVFDSIP